MPDSIIFSGSTNRLLALLIAKQLGIKLGSAEIIRFSDGELKVKINTKIAEPNIFLLSAASHSSQDNIIELIFLAHAIKKSALSPISNITALIPYFAYARQTQSAHIILQMLATAGINKIISLDLHSPKIQKLSPLPIDNLTAAALFVEDLKTKHLADLLIISPDLGSVARARAVAKLLGDIDLVTIDKQRSNAKQAISMYIVDPVNKINNKNCIIIDDIVDTANTICHAAKLLHANGARSIIAYCTHAVLSGAALENIAGSILDEVVVSNSIPLSANAAACKKIRQLFILSILTKKIKLGSYLPA